MTIGGMSTSDPLAPVSGQFALTGTRSTGTDDTPSALTIRPWGLRRAEAARAGLQLPPWRYDQERQLAVTVNNAQPLTELPVSGPTANTTASTDGEDPPSAEDWIND